MPGRTEVYKLPFRPAHIGESHAQLTMLLPTDEQFKYDLFGIGEKPLAQDHIILECRARKMKEAFIMLKNPYPD